MGRGRVGSAAWKRIAKQPTLVPVSCGWVTKQCEGRPCRAGKRMRRVLASASRHRRKQRPLSIPSRSGGGGYPATPLPDAQSALLREEVGGGPVGEGGNPPPPTQPPLPRGPPREAVEAVALGLEAARHHVVAELRRGARGAGMREPRGRGRATLRIGRIPGGAGETGAPRGAMETHPWRSSLGLGGVLKTTQRPTHPLS